MYWPIGAPKVYALSKHATPAAKTGTSDDGADTGEADPSSAAARRRGDDSPSEQGVSGSGPVEPGGQAGDDEILAARISRGGSIFATITRSALTVWQSKPTVALAAVVRSATSMKAYGPSTALHMRPDGLIIVVQTEFGYMITYTLSTDPQAPVYQTQISASARHARKDSVEGYNPYRRLGTITGNVVPGEQEGIRELNLRFRMVIRIDAGIRGAIALDDELVVTTQRPAAVQCIRWSSEAGASQTQTELLSKMLWLKDRCAVVQMVHDKPMNLACWLTDDGRAYAVQRKSGQPGRVDDQAGLFYGFCFREATGPGPVAAKLAINARFSLIAVGCDDGSIEVFVVKDYTGNIPRSHRIPAPTSTTDHGGLELLSYSPDGYCLFAGYQKGWALWTVYGKSTASSFGVNRSISEANDEQWLHGVVDGFWSGAGCELILLSNRRDRLSVLQMARNAATGCMLPANVCRGLLHSSDSIITYAGHGISDVTALPADATLWRSVQVPNHYLVNQWPIKSAAISPDGKYVAVAGRRGLAHYSISSGRWKSFDDPEAEQSFAVRGGMCWHQHFLIASVETGGRYQIRIYSREKALERVMYTEQLEAPVLLTTATGSDSLLVYTYENLLLHYIIVPHGGSSVQLVQVGQIGFHGIIRAPPRVRSISWILPEDQLEHGDPSQDVATACVIFLVDGKLVLLQPSQNEHGDLKYGMRVIAHNVEHYILMRDQPAASADLKAPLGAQPAGTPNGFTIGGPLGHSLRDSLWYFDGTAYHVWSDVQDVLASAPAELGRELPPVVRIPIDFCPASAMVSKGIVHGLDADLAQRRDIDFSFFRLATRAQLFLPPLLRYHLSEYNSPAALHLASSYQHLPYFAHALEVLLHDVLDSEVDNPPSPAETALLPTVISFLSSFQAYLDIIVNCTRKTELRSWRTLFAYLPPVRELFEMALMQDKLKTASGYLLVLHTFEADSFQVKEFARLLKQAAAEQAWDLCAEVARFLVGIDASGKTLAAALSEAGLRGMTNGSLSDSLSGGMEERSPSTTDEGTRSYDHARNHANGTSSSIARDYFSLGSHG